MRHRHEKDKEERSSPSQRGKEKEKRNEKGTQGDEVKSEFEKGNYKCTAGVGTATADVADVCSSAARHEHECALVIPVPCPRHAGYAAAMPLCCEYGVVHACFMPRTGKGKTQ